LLFIDAPVQFHCWLYDQFSQSPAGNEGGRGFAAVEDQLPGFHPAPKNREKIRYRITTGDRHAHNSPNVVNNALTKLKKLQRC
jgi:hypothetical protein